MNGGGGGAWSSTLIACEDGQSAALSIDNKLTAKQAGYPNGSKSSCRIASGATCGEDGQVWSGEGRE